MSAHPAFWEEVDLKYQIYNALFLNLPFRHVRSSGILLPVFAERARARLAAGVSPREIVDAFLDEQTDAVADEDRLAILFTFLQIVERQVVLFDALEDAAFGRIHDLEGPGTLHETLNRIHLDGKEADLARIIADFRVRIVLTAHPTQFYPGSVLGIITDLAHALQRNDLSGIYDLLLQLGKTRFRNRNKPTPREEAQSLLWYLEHVFYNSFAEVHGKLSMAARRSRREALKLGATVELGFWPGGDRDGNPFVNAQTTREVAATLRRTILGCYLFDLERISRRLTFDGAIERVRQIRQRVEATRDAPEPVEGGYTTSGLLLEDLMSLWTLLSDEHDGLFRDHIEKLIWRVQVFGFHFATLDIRQDSRVFAESLGIVLDGNAPVGQETRSPDQFAILERLLDAEIAPTTMDVALHRLGDRPVLRDTIEALSEAHRIQQLGGERALHRCIISNTRSPQNVLQVLLLARIAGYPSGAIDLDVVPLFETVDDLSHAVVTMSTLYESSVYRSHLEHRGNRQTIMLGFSDGTKDGGYVTANWLIHRAKEQLTTIAAGYGVRVVFFEGRGGPPARGGGKTHQFYRAMSRNTARDQIHLTIQGQTISSNFGTETAARFNLEQLVTAGLENLLFSEYSRDLTQREQDLMNQLSDTSLARYRGLKMHRAFLAYLERMTPLQYYGEANNASRPTSRGNVAGLDFQSLRAIPFVGAWSQMKQNVPGYFGFGTALGELIAGGARAQLQQLYRDQLFFRTLLENSMQSLSKVNLDATRYIESDPEFGSFWKEIADEAERTRRAILECAGAQELLPDDHALRASIALREAIVEPVVVIQQYALQRLRIAEESPESTDTLRKIVIKSMAAIVNAGRNSV